VIAPATQQGGCLHFTQTWPNFWQLWHCVKTVLSFIAVYPDCDVAKTWQSENFSGFCRRREGHKEQGELYDCWFCSWMRCLRIHVLISKQRFDFLMARARQGNWQSQRNCNFREK
jgi:hypothetical protein